MLTAESAPQPRAVSTIVHEQTKDSSAEPKSKLFEGVPESGDIQTRNSTNNIKVKTSASNKIGEIRKNSSEIAGELIDTLEDFTEGV